MLTWSKLLSTTRRRTLDGDAGSIGSAHGREEHERDYDRILFAAPTRRLADKTQVFPMEENDSVRTRLTHSHEVSNLARSIGTRLAFDHAVEVFGEDHEALCVKRRVPALLAAVGLAHDLGNPPFGHQGEASIQKWFDAAHNQKDGPVIEADFLRFDGNAQTLRLVTRLQLLNDDYGLNLTCGTLAALIKYPGVYGKSAHGYKKHGVFASEEKIARTIWEQTGLPDGVRHPLTLVMEACDDIAYSVIDAEDTVKKACASFYDLVDFIETRASDEISRSIVEKSRAKNSALKQHGLSSRELNDVSMQMFRTIAITVMVKSATETFVGNVSKLMSGTVDAKFELIKMSSSAGFCEAVKTFDRIYGFQHRDVLRLELQGHNFIHAVMTMIWKSIPSHPDQDLKPFAKYVYGSISENYRRVYEASDRECRARRQLVCDAVSGMTEGYLIKFHDELKRLDHVC